MRGLTIAAVLMLGVGVGARVARAEQPFRAVSVHVPSLGSSGLGLQYEQRASRRWSFAGSLGGRRAAGGDYASFAAGVALEGRYWFLARTRWSGPFAALRLAAGYTTVSEVASDRTVGESVNLTPALALGWRWRIRSVELTPSLGLGAEAQLDPSGRLASAVVPRATIGLTLGWVF